MKIRYLLILWAIVLPAFVLGITHHVKLDGSGDYIGIQTALDAANPGDTVLVYPGRYYENLSIGTNGINLLSLEATTGNPTYIDSTIIDGNHIGQTMRIEQGVTNIKVQGFSITRGLSIGSGGGMLIFNGVSLNVSSSKIYGNIANLGGGLSVLGASATFSNVEVFDNNSVVFGGGFYIRSVSGYTYSVNFDPINRCSIYNNRSGAGQDIYIKNATRDLEVYLDTFSVSIPTPYYASYLGQNLADFQMHFDILNVHHQEIDSDLYVSPEGDDANDGLCPATALKTIHTAIYRVASDSLNQKTVHLLPGTYSRTDNEQIFPIALKSYVTVQGSGMDSTLIVGEPHPQIPLGHGYMDNVFQAHPQIDVSLSNLSITTQNSNNSCAIAAYTRGSVNLSNIHIYDVRPDTAAVLMFNYCINIHWDNLIIENIETPNMGLIYADGYISGSITNSIFRNAVSTYVSESVWAAPLIWITGDGDLSFENCVFDNLTVYDDDTYAFHLGAVQFPQQQNHFSFKNSIFSNINTKNDMIFVGSKNYPNIDFINCTFAGNKGDTYTLKVNGNVNIINSIFDNDTPYQINVNPMGYQITEHTNLTIDHSCIKDGIDGILPFPVPGNTIDFLPTSISGDPLFAGGFDVHDPLYYSLSEYSPCINSGTPDLTELGLPPYDLAGNWRVWDNRIDMGCFEYGSEPWVSNDDPVLPEPVQVTLQQNYPNPFNPTTTISYFLPEAAKIQLDVYNLKGQLVKSLINADQAAGKHNAIWDGKDSKNHNVASGVYLYRLSSPSKSLTKRMLLMK